MSYIEFEKLEVVKGFKVVFPSLVTQEALLEWKQCLAQVLRRADLQTIAYYLIQMSIISNRCYV